MPQGGKLSYKSLSTCIADAKKQGVSTKPCEERFNKKKKKPIDGSLDPRKPRKKGVTY